MSTMLLDYINNNLGLVAIHCDTKEKARKLCDKLDSLGYCWCNGESYSGNTDWEVFEEDSCYVLQTNNLCSIEDCIIDGIYIIEYSDKFLEENKDCVLTIELRKMNKIISQLENDINAQQYDKLKRAFNNVNNIIYECIEKGEIR